MIPMLQEFGVDARWEVIQGDAMFYDMTKKVHNSLQGDEEVFTKEMWDYHYEINRRNAQNLDLDADAVLIHDPQPAPLVQFRKKGTWMWRCHIDVSNPRRDTWDCDTRYGEQYDAADLFRLQVRQADARRRVHRSPVHRPR